MKKGDLKKASDFVFVDVSPIAGKGVFAQTDIPAGTVVGRFEGYEAQKQSKFVLTTEDKKGRPYLLRVANEFRYLNHANRPNLEIQEDLSLVTKRAVKRGKELFIDYGPDFRASIS